MLSYLLIDSSDVSEMEMLGFHVQILKKVIIRE